jgi:hypothetical protein
MVAIGTNGAAMAEILTKRAAMAAIGTNGAAMAEIPYQKGSNGGNRYQQCGNGGNTLPKGRQSWQPPFLLMNY